MPDPAPSSVEPTLDLPPPGDTQTLPPTSHAHALTGPPTVPGFEIEGELGRGGMGVVYRARQTKLNRSVALKMVLAGGHAGPAERVRFLAEAEAIAAVQHPGIVQVYEFGTCGEQPYFALEFCPGGSLAARLAGTPLPPKEAAQLVEKIARAVQAAHDAGIVHRDLKPDNVLFAADGSPKVTDFGLARKVEGDSGLTKTGAIMGTPSYMAPEQATGRKDVGPAADVWAVGAILYECLTGRPPFRAANALDTVLQVASDDPVPPRALVPNLPRDVETIAVKCLQKEPAKRYASAGALADDLRHFLDGEPIAARPVSWAEKSWKKMRRRPLLYALACLTAFFATFAVGTLFNSVRRSEAARAKLQAQAEELDREATAARRAQAAADAERAKAQARLETAVEAVEKTLNRAGTARWARDPALARERRALLEDAVAFYEGFRDEDAADPLVRRQAARAHRRIAGVYILLAEYPKAAAALARARAVGERLAAEFPDDPGYAADLAETMMFVGHASAAGGRMDEAKAAYRAAAGLARKALAGRPDDEDIRRTLTGCLTGLAFYTMQADPPAAAALFEEALGHAGELMARPDPPFTSRALAAYTYAGATLFAFFSGNPAGGQAHAARAAELLAATTPDPTAPAHSHDVFDLAGGMLKMTAGLMAAGRPAEAAPLLRGASEVFDRLLAVYPKAFQYRLFKVIVLAQEVDTLVRLKRGGEARLRRDELLATEDEILKTSPNLGFVKTMTARHRVRELTERVTAGDVAGFDRLAEDLLAAVPIANPNSSNFRYDLACAYSLASRHGTPAEREARAAKAVALLTGLLDGPVYRGPTTAHVDGDTDLEPIRKRADFEAFRAKMPAKK